MVMKEQYTIEEMITAIVATKGNLTAVAEALGCDRGTVAAYKQRYKAIRVACAQEREKMIDLAEQNLQNHLAKGSFWPATKFSLSTVGKARGYSERVELTGADGHAIEVEQTFKDALDKAYGGEEVETSSEA